jgi:hypothetical protein
MRQDGQPNVETFGCDPGQRHTPFFSTFALYFMDAMFARRLEIADAQPTKFPDTAAGIGENVEDRAVTDPDRRYQVRCFEQTTTIRGRQTNRFAIFRRRGHGD